MGVRRLCALGTALLGAVTLSPHAGIGLAAQQRDQPLPMFRSGIDLVQLDVVVLDANRQPVEGLTAADFTVLDDGRPRPLQAFAPIVLPPARRPDAGDPMDDRPGAVGFHSDVTTNERQDDGRLVVILVDRSIDVGQPTVAARRIGHAIVDALGPNDLAAVMRTSLTSGSGGRQNFTSDRRRLHRTLDDPFMGLTNPPDMTSGGLTRPLNPALDSKAGECPLGQCVLEALTTVARALANDPRRQKIIFFVGSQIAFQDSDLQPDGQLSIERRHVMESLSRANVTVHVIDPRGLETLMTDAGQFRPDANVAGRLQNNLARQSALGVLPGYTGGRTILNTNDPATQVPQLLDEGRIYYLLAFERGATDADGRLHPLRVLVNRPGVTVRARSGYFASATEDPAGPAVDPATQATRGLLPLGDLPLRLVAMPVFDDGFVRAAVGIGVPRGLFPAGDEHFDAVVEALDDRANIVSSQGTSFGPENVKGDSVQQSIRVPLKPGRYEIRVGVSDWSGLAGSVYGNVDVPDIAHRDVALSWAVFLPVPDEVDMVPMLLVPSVTRAFDATSPTSAFWQVFRRGGQPVHISAAIIGTRGQTVARTDQTLESGERNAALITTHRLRLPRAAMAPGQYVLQLTATSGHTTDRREVAFEVR
jgi:VWFA-related protein